MSTIIILPQYVPQKEILINSLNVPYYDFDILVGEETSRQTQLTNIERVGFIWENNNSRTPFGQTIYSYVVKHEQTDLVKQEQSESSLFYFTYEFVEFVKSLYDLNNNLIVDLITCSFNTQIAQNDINYLKQIMRF